MLRLELLTLLLLHGAALLGYLPLAPYLQRLPALAVPAAIVFSLIARQRRLLLRERPALLIAAGCFLYYALQFNRHNIAAPAANLLTILLAIRLVGEKSPRNIMQGFTLALFCLAASTLFSLSPGFAVYLLLLLLIITVSLVLLTFQSHAPAYAPPLREIRAIVSVALLQPVAAMPLILLLFFILPRTQLPLWQGIAVTGNDRSGISESVQPGDKSVVTAGKATVFRAETGQLPPELLYWRVTVLNAVQGDSWLRRPAPDGEQKLAGGRSITQTIYLEPGRPNFLPALNLPESQTYSRTGPTADRVLPATALPRGRKSYGVVSRSGATIVTARINRDFYTRLPDNVPPRLLAISRSITAAAENDAGRLQRLEKAFVDLRLSYASSGLPTGPQALERFLFIDRRGHCELFATAFATALRAAGIPARLVGGYYGGDYNELAGYYAVAEEQAHLWVEAWLEGQGWVTVDPSRLAANFEEARRAKSSPLLLRLRLFADTLTYYWNRAVITYDLESQFAAINRAGAGLRSLRTGELPRRKVAAVAVGLLLIAALAYLATRRRPTAEERLLAAFRKTLQKRYGLVIKPASGLHEAVGEIDNLAVQRFVAVYTGAVYRDRKLTAAEIGELRQLLATIAKNRLQTVERTS